MEKLYGSLAFDLAGARSKNRFRNEILWGLEKIFDIYKQEENFFVVFDYVCDIEFHFNNRYEFYQIKTSNSGSAYTITKISKPDKAGNSILGKIFRLKDPLEKEGVYVKVALVVNTPLKTEDRKVHSSEKEIEFIELDEKSKNKIIGCLKKECGSDVEIILNNAYYIYTSMDLFNPNNSLMGQLINFFVEVTGKEPQRVTTLWRLLVDTITMKASYELECKTYDDLIDKKALSKQDFEKMFKRYIDISNKSIEVVKKEIGVICTDYSEKTQMNIALSKIVRELSTSKSLKKLESNIVEYIIMHLENFNKDIKECMNDIFIKFQADFDVEYSRYEIYALIIYILVRVQEGLYEEVTN